MRLTLLVFLLYLSICSANPLVQTGFERHLPEGLILNASCAEVSDDPQWVISGRRSLVIHGAGAGRSQSALHTDFRQLPLLPNVRYAVTFLYEMKELQDEVAHFRFSVKSDSGAVKDIRPVSFRESPFRPTRQEIHFVVQPEVEDCRVHLDVRGAAVMIIDDFTVSPLPDMNTGNRGIQVDSEDYEPYGMCTHLSWRDEEGIQGYRDDQVVRAIELMKAAGVQWIRTSALWKELEPEQGRWNEKALKRVDLIVETALRNDLDILMLPGMQPQWASSCPTSPRYASYAPTDMTMWASHLETLARRYRGKVRAWEIRNEIDTRFWLSSLEDYADYLKAASRVLKTVDPNNRVVLAGLSSNGVHTTHCKSHYEEWALDKLYQAGIRDSFDIMALHPYVGFVDHATVISCDKINTAYSVMCRYGDGHKPIWVTEVGWNSRGNEEGMTLQARYLKSVYTELIRHPRVEKIFYYSFRRLPNGDDQGGHLAIVENNFAWRPAFKLYSELTKEKDRYINPCLLERFDIGVPPCYNEVKEAEDEK